MAAPLTAPSLDRLRREAERHLPGTAIIMAAAGTSNLGGGRTAPFTPVGTVACRIAEIQGQELVAADRVTQESEAIVTLPRATYIDVALQLQIDGQLWEVTHVRPRSYEVTRRVEVKKVGT